MPAPLRGGSGTGIFPRPGTAGAGTAPALARPGSGVLLSPPSRRYDVPRFATKPRKGLLLSAHTPGELWWAAKSVDATRPFLTSYDPATDVRVEMSFATFDNWVAKTANMLVDGLGALPGDTVALALPLHWQSLAWTVACWVTGTTVVLAEADIPEADVVVADASRVDAALASGAREVVGASLHPLGLPMDDCPPAATDYTQEARGYGDAFAPPKGDRSSRTSTFPTARSSRSTKVPSTSPTNSARSCGRRLSKRSRGSAAARPSTSLNSPPPWRESR